jgi:hypothetical protein
MLLVMGAAPALAEGTTGVEPTGGAERAMAAKPDTLVTWVKGVAKCKVEKMPQEGECKRRMTVMLQGNLTNLNGGALVVPL